MSYDSTIELHKVGDPASTITWRTLIVALTDEEAEIVKQSDITHEVTAALWRKQIDGVKKHGYAMQPGDQVDALKNAFEEAIDLSQYLMKAIMEEVP